MLPPPAFRRTIFSGVFSTPELPHESLDSKERTAHFQWDMIATAHAHNLFEGLAPFIYGALGIAWILASAVIAGVNRAFLWVFREEIRSKRAQRIILTTGFVSPTLWVFIANFAAKRPEIILLVWAAGHVLLQVAVISYFFFKREPKTDP